MYRLLQDIQVVLSSAHASNLFVWRRRKGGVVFHFGQQHGWGFIRCRRSALLELSVATSAWHVVKRRNRGMTSPPERAPKSTQNGWRACVVVRTGCLQTGGDCGRVCIGVHGRERCIMGWGGGASVVKSSTGESRIQNSARSLKVFAFFRAGAAIYTKSSEIRTRSSKDRRAYHEQRKSTTQALDCVTCVQ